LVARLKREIGLSFVGMLFTDRESHRRDGGVADEPSNGHNRVFGPDFEWRPSGSDFVSGQLLYSGSQTPVRPDLAEEWTGRHLSGHAASVQWGHNSKHLDWYGRYNDYGNGFRADNGFVPQVGYREVSGSSGWTVRPKGFVSRQRTFINVDYQADRSGAVISRQVVPGFGLDTKWDGFVQLRYIDEDVRAGDRLIGRKQFGYVAQFSPWRRLSQLSLDGRSGQEIDFANGRPGRGTSINLSGRFNPTEHLELALVQNQGWLNVDDAAGAGRRLFIARVSRMRSTYTFTSRLFLRGIAQYVSTRRDPSLYLQQVPEKSGSFSGSLLLAYKLNWQSVMFVGYGDERELIDTNRLAPLDRQFFVKLSYALQR
jgi:hypothetical protein